MSFHNFFSLSNFPPHFKEFFASRLLSERNFFLVHALGRIISGQCIGKIIIFSFQSRSAHLKIKISNCAIMSTQVAYETDQISLLCD